MVFWFGRVKTSLIGSAPPAPVSAPSVSVFDQVNEAVVVTPCLKRCVTLVWSASYQVLPKSAHSELMVPNCGNGRSDCASVWPIGKPVYGTRKPRACGRPDEKVAFSRF